jgi:sulfur carrier protein ThiS adenylyltransferase
MKISITLNNKKILIEQGKTVFDIKNCFVPNGDVIILNTVINPDNSTILNEDDSLVIFKKGELPDSEDLQTFFLARQSREVTDILKNSKVGVAGLGGLGSVVVENLVRAGVGELVVADFDVVDPSNLNRQRYFVNQIGKFKTDAIYENISKISNMTKVKTVCEKVTKDNCKFIFEGCQVVAECFDSPLAKAELVKGVRKHLPDAYVIAVSGVAGVGSEKEITTKKISDKIFVVGDFKSEVRDGYGLVATRVGIAASIQSHIVVRLLIGEEK